MAPKQAEAYEGGGGGWLINKVLHGRLPPEVQVLTLLYTIFEAPLSYIFHWHIPSLERCIDRITAANALTLHYEKITKPENFRDFFYDHKVFY